MEWADFLYVGAGFFVGGIILAAFVLFFGFAMGLSLIVGSHGNKTKGLHDVAGGVSSIVILVLGSAAAVLLSTSFVQSTAGKCLNSLPDGNYAYDVMFMNETRSNSYYLVVRGSDGSKSNIPTIPTEQRCVELENNAHVLLKGMPVHGILPSEVLKDGLLTVTTERGPGGFKWKQYDLAPKE